MNKTKDIAKIDDSKHIDTFALLEQATSLVNVVSKSKVFNQFNDKEDAIACILLGHEIGLAPMESLSFGKRLTVEKIQSVIKGRSLNIDTVTSLEHIHQIKTANGVVSIMGIQLITALLLRAGIKIDFVEDFRPLYQYIDMSGEVYLQETIESSKDMFQIITENTPDSKYDKDKIQVAFTNKEYTRRTKVKMTRGDIVIEISYTLQQATDAGLYRGIHSKTGNEVKGKDNWNSHEATMLRNRPVSICGRLIGGDVINGVYTFEEVLDIDKTLNLNEEEGVQVLRDKDGNVIAKDIKEVDDIIETSQDTVVDETVQQED